MVLSLPRDNSGGVPRLPHHYGSFLFRTNITSDDWGSGSRKPGGVNSAQMSAGNWKPRWPESRAQEGRGGGGAGVGRDRRQGGKSREHAPTHIPPSQRASLNPEEKLRKEKTYSSEVGKERGVSRGGGVFNLTRGPRRTKQQFGWVWQREETKAS